MRKTLTVHFPPGFIGNPHATPQCTIAQFSADECPIDSQVGVANVLATNGIPFDTAVYNIVPPPDDAGLLAFKVFLFDTPQFTVLGARTGSDYGLDSDTPTQFFTGSCSLGRHSGGALGRPRRFKPRPPASQSGTNSSGGPLFTLVRCATPTGELATEEPGIG